jgi:putative transposase
VAHLQDAWKVGVRGACALIQFSRSLHHYKPKRSGQAVLRQRIKEIAAVRVRYGYQPGEKVCFSSA